MFDDKRQSWEILDVPNKLEKLKKLKKTVIVATTAIALLGSVFHFREEYRLLPNDQLNVTFFQAESQQGQKPKLFEAYSAFIFLTASSGTWTVPNNWNNSNNRFDAVGAGGNGSAGSLVGSPARAKNGAGGGGGGWAYNQNVALTPGSTRAYAVGVAGSGSGGYSYVNGIVGAYNGANGNANIGGAGGNGFSGLGAYSGGAGASEGGGGGAAGPGGNGSAGVYKGNGGAGRNGTAGGYAGGDGGNGNNLANGTVGGGGGGALGSVIETSTGAIVKTPGGDGGYYGGGGGGGATGQTGGAIGQFSNGGVGRQGIIAISYVPRVNSSTSISSNLNPSTYGAAVKFTATVTSGATGSCTFYVDGVSIGNGTISGTTATITTSNLSTAAHSVYAVYNGDSNYFGSTSGTITQTVNKAASSISLVSSVNPSVFGNSITLTATVTNGATGSVTFYDNGVNLGNATITGSTATLTTNTLSTGTHPLTATYNGDANYNSSSSNTVNEVVNKITTSLVLTSSPNPQQFGPLFTVDLTATVAPGGGDGFIIYKINGVEAANIALISSANSIVWSPNTTLFNIGNNSVIAQYSGNINYNGSVSNTATESISFSGRPFNIFING